MNKSSKLFGVGLAMLGAVSLCGISGAAVAGSITEPGELAGLALATPLPEGLYFVDTFSYGNFRGLAYNSSAAINVPVIAWSTPWTFLGGHIYAYAAVPSVMIDANNYSAPATVGGGNVSLNALYNPAAIIGEAWDFGNGFSAGVGVGGYAPVNNILNQNFFTFNVRPSLAWSGDGWSLTANTVFGVTGNNNGGNGNLYGKTSPNYFNYDLGAIKTIDKWSLGVVGFGSLDVSGVTSPYPLYPSYSRQSQFAAGLFAAYNFGPLTVQGYVTRDVFSNNYVNFYGDKVYATTAWLRVVAALWNPPPPAPLVAKY
ncbi:transporter [Methylocella sp.]|jgi:hypothetical protein|uniref:transporter n=1 Tax=Methylocella sp. TaxID=1978226 RepID=UPI003C222EBD